jgi:dolichyl-phosphate-mannose--protein O-mannosyl transferase
MGRRLYLHIILYGQLTELHEMAVSLLAKRGSGRIKKKKIYIYMYVYIYTHTYIYINKVSTPVTGLAGLEGG